MRSRLIPRLGRLVGASLVTAGVAVLGYAVPVFAAPAFPTTISKAFGAATIPLNGSTSLTFTLTNPNASPETGVAFSDTLPAGLIVATPNGFSSTCGGTPTAVAGSGSVSLTGGDLAASGSCTFAVNVTGSSAGVQNNVSGAVSSTEDGAGGTASASVTVIAPPVITKSFGAASVPLNGSTGLSFTINNTNGSDALTGVAFTDSLPAGLVVATPNGLSGTCGGGTITAVAASGSVSLSGATIAASGSCTFSVNVTGSTAGVKNNSVQVTSTDGGTGNTSNASVTVIAPPVLTKAFGAATVALNGSTSLTFTVQNNNTTAGLTGVDFSDTLPAGLVVATPNGLSGTCGGGTITAVAASSSVSLSGASLAASSSCTFSVNVTGTTAGVKNNTTGSVTSTEGGTGGTGSASVTVISPPALTKAFGAASVVLNGSTSLTFVVNNNNGSSSLSGIGFTDSLPAGVVVATPNGLSGSCGGGTITAVAASGSVSLSGATIAASGSCTFSVNVLGTTSGTKNNTTSVVASTQGGSGSAATASFTVSAASGGTGSKPISVAMVNPNGGETVHAGFNYTVLFTAEGTSLAGVRLSLSTDGGATYPTVLIDNLYNNGYYSWSVPMMTTTTTAKIKIQGLAVGGAVAATATSASNFIIEGTEPAVNEKLTEEEEVKQKTEEADEFTDKNSDFPSGTHEPKQYSDEEKNAPKEDPTEKGKYAPEDAKKNTPTIDVDKNILPPTMDKKLPCTGGDLLMTPASKAVYYCGKNGKRYVFLSQSVFASWFTGFSDVKTISAEEMAAIPLAGNVTYRPGERMIKIQSDPKVYAVSRSGLLRWVKDEATAKALYGNDWNKKIDDVSDAFFSSYAMGDPITTTAP